MPATIRDPIFNNRYDFEKHQDPLDSLNLSPELSKIVSIVR